MKNTETTKKRAITYSRASVDVSVQKNSINVQQTIMSAFAETHGYEIEAEFVDYESGAVNERESFNRALEYAKEEGVFIIAHRIDRISRNLEIFAKITNLLPSFRFCELGNTEPNTLVCSLLLAMAQQERLNCGVRIAATHKTLKKANPDHPWGNPRIKETAIPVSLKVRKKNAREFNAKIQGLCEDLKRAGYLTLKDLANKLNELGFTTRRGKAFTIATLHRVLAY